MRAFDKNFIIIKKPYWTTQPLSFCQPKNAKKSLKINFQGKNKKLWKTKKLRQFQITDLHYLRRLKKNAALKILRLSGCFFPAHWINRLMGNG